MIATKMTYQEEITTLNTAVKILSMKELEEVCEQVTTHPYFSCALALNFWVFFSIHVFISNTFAVLFGGQSITDFLPHFVSGTTNDPVSKLSYVSVRRFS